VQLIIGVTDPSPDRADRDPVQGSGRSDVSSTSSSNFNKDEGVFVPGGTTHRVAAGDLPVRPHTDGDDVILRRHRPTTGSSAAPARGPHVRRLGQRPAQRRRRPPPPRAASTNVPPRRSPATRTGRTAGAGKDVLIANHRRRPPDRLGSASTILTLVPFLSVRHGHRQPHDAAATFTSSSTPSRSATASTRTPLLPTSTTGPRPPVSQEQRPQPGTQRGARRRARARPPA